MTRAKCLMDLQYTATITVKDCTTCMVFATIVILGTQYGTWPFAISAGPLLSNNYEHNRKHTSNSIINSALLSEGVFTIGLKFESRTNCALHSQLSIKSIRVSVVDVPTSAIVFPRYHLTTRFVSCPTNPTAYRIDDAFRFPY